MGLFRRDKPSPAVVARIDQAKAHLADGDIPAVEKAIADAFEVGTDEDRARILRAIDDNTHPKQ